MICQSCQKHEATVHQSEVRYDAAGEPLVGEVHLCAPCAKSAGIPIAGASDFPKLVSMLSKAFSGQPTAISADTSPAQQPDKGACPSCGWTLEDFRQKSRFGCPNDYDLFSDFVSGVLNRIHGYAQHPDISTDTTIERLKEEMQQAVSREDYETASRLRDRVKELEATLGDDPVLD